MTTRNIQSQNVRRKVAVLASLAALGASSLIVAMDPASQASTNSGVSSAKAVVRQYSIRPTASNSSSSLITISKPVGKPIPSGKAIYFVSCGAPSCDALGLVVQHAAQTVGWTGTVLHTDGSSQEIQNAWQQIVRAKPAGAIVAGTALSEAQPYISQAAANGTAVAAYAVTEPLGSADAKGVIWETSTAKQFGIFGKIIAAQVVTAASTAGNSKPQALFLNIPDISINDQATTQFQSNFKKWCTGCKQYTLNLGLSTISSAPSQIISFLRAHPGVKYIASTNDGSFVGLTSALKSAGITGVSYFGAAPVTANLQQIKNGQQAGTVALGQWEGMYGAVDAIIRHTVGDAQVPGNTGSAPAWIITTKNLAQTDFGTSSYPSSGLVPLDAAIADHYLSLWGKSSS